MPDIDKCRSYATEERLMNSLQGRGLHDWRYVVVRNRAGRWTAIFAGTQSAQRNIYSPAHDGFMVFG